MNWRELNDAVPILESKVGAKYWRDPFIIRAQDGTYHLLCTDGWASKDIIHASSNDLLEWSEQRVLPVMQSFPSAKNAWAPEACYDREKEEYLIFWSSTVDDAFPDHLDKPKDYLNHRIYACRTKDFKTFSETFLFFDPGYNVIDASISHNGSFYLMAFKDERGNNTYFKNETARKHILYATSPTLDGSWEIRSDPISKSSYSEVDGIISENKTETWAEGPTVVWNTSENCWYVFYEYFRNHTFGVSKSEDLKTWEYLDEQLNLPPGTKHGSITEVDNPAIKSKLEAIYTPIDYE